MAIDNERCRELVIEFCKEYRAARLLSYRVRQTPKELYGKYYIEEQHKGILGAFDLRGRRCDLAAANLHDESAVFATLRHEILGHYATNTLAGEDKQRLLNAIGRTRQSSSLQNEWTFVDKNYAGAPEAIKAEEVYCLIAETVGKRVVPAKAVFDDVWRLSIANTEILHLDGLQIVVDYIAEGLKRAVQVQQVPLDSQLLRRTLADEKDDRLEAVLHAALRLRGVPVEAAKEVLRDVMMALKANNGHDALAMPAVSRPKVILPKL